MCNKKTVSDRLCAAANRFFIECAMPVRVGILFFFVDGEGVGEVVLVDASVFVGGVGHADVDFAAVL